MTYLKTRSFRAIAVGFATLVVVGVVFMAAPKLMRVHAFAEGDSVDPTSTSTPVVVDDGTTTPPTDGTSTPDTTAPVVPIVTTDAINDTKVGQTCNFASTVNTDSGATVDDTAATSTLVSPVNSNWIQTITNPNAVWIWGDTLTDPEAQAGSSYTFTQNFWVTGTPTGSLELAADNNYTVSVNGSPVNVGDQDPNGANFGSTHTYDISGLLTSGQINTLAITVTNIGVPGSTALSNPAGLIFGLKIKGDTCSGVSKVFIRKFIPKDNGDGGVTIAQVPNDSTFPDFPMTATWSSPNLGSGTGTYPLGEYFGGAVHKFAARTSYMADTYDYTTSEVTGGNSPVVASQNTCSPGKFYLVGYKTGKNIADALTHDTTTEAPQLVGQTSHNVIVVINAKCPAAPKECTLVSDTGTMADTGGGLGHQPSVAVDPINAAWTAILNGATWIWGENPIKPNFAVHGGSETFTKLFKLDTAPTSDATLVLAADNQYSVSVNGTLVASSMDEDNYSAAGQDTITIPAADLVKGQNKLVVTVTNLPMKGGTKDTNPAGLLYTLTINGANCLDVTPPATLTIVKDTTNGDDTFPFTVAPHETIETAQTATKQVDVSTEDGTGTSDLITLAPGSYDVTENVPDGWKFDSVDCVYNGGGEGTQVTNGETITVDKGDSVTCTFHDTLTQDNNGGGTDGNNGNTGGGVSGQHFSGGSVLGASTTNLPVGKVLGASCSPILTSYLRQGRKNPVDQVKILQNFLNGNLGINLPVTGFFGPATFKAVTAFQTKYYSSVLTPWLPYGLAHDHDATGYVYKTTKYEINYLACPTNGATNPVLP